MSTAKSRRLSRSALRRTNSLSGRVSATFGNASAMNSFALITTPKTGSILSEMNTFDEHDYQTTRQLMHDLIDEIHIDKSSLTFEQMFLQRDELIGCLLRIFSAYADEHQGVKRIRREQMIKLLEESDLFDQQFTAQIFISDCNFLRRQFIRNQVQERKMKTFDFVGFMKCLEMISKRIHRSKDAVMKKIVTAPIYEDLIRLKEVREKIRLGLLPSMETILQQYQEEQMKMSQRKPTKKKKKKKKSAKGSTKKVPKKKKTKKKKKKSIRPTVPEEKASTDQENPIQSTPMSAKEAAQLKTLVYFEPYLNRDEFDKDLLNRLSDVFKSAGDQFQAGWIRKNIFIQWLRTCHIIPYSYANNLIEGVLEGILARNIHAGIYKKNADTFDWNGFLDSIRELARQTGLSLNDFVKKMLTVDEIQFDKWRTESEQAPELSSNTKSNRPWDPKKVLGAVMIMRDVVEESRKLHLTDDERKRLRSLYKEFAAFAYRRQSSHLEARLTNSVLSNWMRECRIFDDKYTVNELDKDFISILGDFTLNGVYPPGTRDIDFDGFLLLIQTIAAHKHIRADDLVQMIFVGPRSPLQKSAEFNEHMDRTKIQTS